MDLQKTIDHIQIKIQMPTPSQEPSVSSKAPKQDLKDMNFLCTLMIMIEIQIWNMGVLKTSDHIKIKIQMPTPSQEPSESSKAPNQN